MAPPANPSHPCIRIATNQSGEPGEIDEPAGPFSIGDTLDVVWQGQTSGATGTMVGYGYNTLGTTPETYQQFIVMRESTGTFVDDEVLLVNENGSGFIDSGIRTRAAADGGVDQQDVDCDSGTGPLPPGTTDPTTDPDVDLTPHCNPHTGLCPGTVVPPEGVDANTSFTLDTEADYSAIAVVTPALVEGQYTGCRAMFVRWEASKIVMTNVDIPQGARFFAPGETFTITPATSSPDPFRFASANGFSTAG